MRPSDNQPWPPAQVSKWNCFVLPVKKELRCLPYSSFWTFCFYLLNGMKHHIKHVAMIAYSWKIGGYFIWFDVNFFPYFTGFENSKKQFFQLALRTFAWLGELLLKFPLVFAQMRQKIDRKFGDILKKAKREIRSHSFCTIVYCFDQWQVERNVAWIENCDTLKITHQDIYTLSIFF